jgi:hypothetical protein
MVYQLVAKLNIMKNLLTFIFLIISTSLLFGQTNISGEYLWADPAGTSAQMLHFKGNNVVYTSFEGDSLVLQGTYSIKNKVIQLSFDEPKILSTLQIKEDTLNQNLNSKLIKLKIFDGENNNIPFYNASVIIKTCDDTSLFLFSDSTGSINFITNDKNLKSFDIVTLGYDVLTIPINGNYGTVEIECILKFSRYNGLGSIPKLISVTKNYDLLDIARNLVYKKIK